MIDAIEADDLPCQLGVSLFLHLLVSMMGLFLRFAEHLGMTQLKAQEAVAAESQVEVAGSSLHGLNSPSLLVFRPWTLRQQVS